MTDLYAISISLEPLPLWAV